MVRINIIFSCLLILFGGWYLWLTTAAPQRRLPHDPGIMFVPRIFASALIFLSILLLLQQLVPRLPHPEEEPPDRRHWREWLQTFGLFGLTVIYTLLLPWFGFLLVTPVYLLAAMLVFGAGWRVRTGAIAILVTGVIYVSFVYFFKVLLPPVPLL